MDNICETVTNQIIGVNTPVKLKPLVDIGEMKIDCRDLKLLKSPCSNKNNCEFTIKQTVSVEIPISYHVDVDTKESYVDCN